MAASLLVRATVRFYPGVWWHDRVAPALGHDDLALQDAWRLVELAELAGFRRRGVGWAIQDGLLQSVACARVLLWTSIENVNARGFYERRGWEIVHPGFPFPGEPARDVIMGRATRGIADS